MRLKGCITFFLPNPNAKTVRFNHFLIFKGFQSSAKIPSSSDQLSTYMKPPEVDLTTSNYGHQQQVAQ